MAEILSFAYYLAFSFAVFAVSYLLNSKVRKGLVLLAVIIVLATALRNFSYSMRSVATSFGEAYFWTYLAAVAWTLFYYTALLWYVNYLKLKHRKFWNIAATVAYAAALWIFVLSPNSSANYNIRVSRYGMVDVNYFYGVSNSLLDIASTFVNIALFVLFIVFVTYSLRKKSTGVAFSTIKNVNTGFGLAIITAFMLDKTLQVLVYDALPSLSPIASVIVTITILINLRRDGDLISVREMFSELTDDAEIERIVWKRVEMLIIITGLAYFAVSRIVFSGIYNSNIYVIFIVSLLMPIGLGVAREHLKKWPVLLRFVRLALFCTDIFFLYVYNIPNALVTVWFYPYCFAPMFAILKKKSEVIAVTLLVVLFNIYLFVNVPEFVSYNDFTAVITRIFLSILFCVQIYDANKIFIGRAKYTNKLKNLHERFADISASYIEVTQDNIEQKTQNLLNICRDYVGADRAYIVMFDYKTDRMYGYIESCRIGVSELENVFNHIGIAPVQWLIDMMKNNSIARVRNINEIPEITLNDTMYLALSGTRSMYCAPIINSNSVAGMVCIVYTRAMIELSVEDEDFLLYAANTQANALSLIESQRRINYVAYYNTLTNLPNKFEFAKLLREYHEKHKTESFALAFLDIDSFQEINDTIGHDDGDELLVLLASELGRKIGGGDVLAHYSGDEFAILLSSVNSKHEAALRLEEIIGAVRKPKRMLNREFFVTASIGVSIYQIDAVSVDELIHNAELAQFVAKRSGKNRYVICDESMKLDNQHSQFIKREFESAIERGELEMYYQPILFAEDARLSGFEALLRWNSKDFGQLRPNEFMNISEDFGTDMRLCDFIIRSSLSQLRSWNESGLKTRLTMNFSDKQINNPQLMKKMFGLMEEMNINPQSLLIEFSERFGDEIRNESLQEIRRMGAAISMDDFGSKNSSLSRIINLDISEIKIDKGFVHRIGMSAKDDGIGISIIEMAKSLGIKVTALGIETGEQYEFFKNSGCDYVQGYSFYEPMNASDATDLLVFESSKRC